MFFFQCFRLIWTNVDKLVNVTNGITMLLQNVAKCGNANIPSKQKQMKHTQMNVRNEPFMCSLLGIEMVCISLDCCDLLVVGLCFVSTSRWPFSPEFSGNMSRVIVKLIQMWIIQNDE